ncbi:Zn-ribbon domain-containing OB-fold protein [Aeromicrobium sp. 9AM]|uniref:Zn-ribbon domain-containing OB-fold protein n=1 Tax=Aeromicrobium sp. 9AM TaxID=2653126 RepID=UPI0012F1864E|nr:Zn-ribbon domain-containing OB-fold protein [Aeromicrobium sp. 9AM]VXB61347.1 conserved hypothetical protein [Aeromicrobium sp. 9AM]
MTHHFPGGLPTPRPVIEPDAEPWWDAAGRGELTVPYCEACGRPFWYPRGFCPRCGSTGVVWRPATGEGTVYSYTVVRRAAEPWGSHTPFVLAYVTLDEGVTVQTNIVDCSSDVLEPGLRVRAVFERADDADLPVLRFTPVDPVH